MICFNRAESKWNSPFHDFTCILRLLLLLLVLSACSVLSNSNNNQKQGDILKQTIAQSSSHFILASSYLRPGQPFKVLATIFRSKAQPAHITCNIYRDTVIIASAVRECPFSRLSIPQEIVLDIPEQLATNHSYQLKVEGDWDLESYQSTAVIASHPLQISSKTASLLVYTDRSLYRQGDLVHIRVIALNNELSVYPGPLRLRLLDPLDNELQRWPSKQPDNGLVQLQYQLSSRVRSGLWRIEASLLTGNYTQHGSFLVVEFEPAEFEVRVWLPSLLNTLQPYVNGWISANYSTGIPIFGNVTIYATVKPVATFSSSIESFDYQRELRQPSTIEYTIERFQGYAEFSFEMTELARIAGNSISLHGSQLTITAYVGDQRLNLVNNGFASAKLVAGIGGELALKFLGGSRRTFKPFQSLRAYCALYSTSSLPVAYDQLKDRELAVQLLLHLPGNRKTLPTQQISMLDGPNIGLWEIRIDLTLLVNPFELQQIERVEVLATYAAAASSVSEFLNENPNLDSRVGEQTSESLKSNQLNLFDADLSAEGNKSESKYHSYELLLPFAVSNRNLSAWMLLIPFHSPKKLLLSVWTSSSESIRLGENVVFHVRSNFDCNLLHYVLLAQQTIAGHERIEMRSRILTFHQPVVPSMVPECTLLVYCFHQNEIISDSLTFPVSGFIESDLTRNRSRRKLDLRFQVGHLQPEELDQSLDGWDRAQEIRLLIQTGAGHSTNVALSSIQTELNQLLPWNNRLSQSSIWMNLLGGQQQSTSTEIGHQPEKSVRFEFLDYNWNRPSGPCIERRLVQFPSASKATDSWANFERLNLFVSTNATIYRLQSPCDVNAGFRVCASGLQCFKTLQRCNGRNDCDDKSDEENCSGTNLIQEEFTRIGSKSALNGRLQRNLLSSDFEPTWLWTNVHTDMQGLAPSLALPVHGSLAEQQQLTVSAFALQEGGIGLINKRLTLNVQRPFGLILELPNSCYEQEVLAARIHLINRMRNDLEVLVSLDRSPGFHFVQLQQTDFFQMFQSHSGGSSAYAHQVFVHLKSGQSRTLNLPVIAAQSGLLTLTARAKILTRTEMSQATIQVKRRSLRLRYRAPLRLQLHDSSEVLQLDWLKQPVLRPLVQQFGPKLLKSSRLRLIVSGDRLGRLPIQDKKDDLLEHLPVWHAEQVALEFALQMQQLHRLHRNIIRKNSDEIKLRFRFVNLLLQSLLSFQNQDSGFRRYVTEKDTSRMSVTVFILQALSQALKRPEYQLWIHIDKNSVRKASRYLISNQNKDGSFGGRPNKLSSSKSQHQQQHHHQDHSVNEDQLQRIELTAHVLLALTELKTSLQVLRLKTQHTIKNGLQYLESRLEWLVQHEHQPHLALVAFCLSKNRSNRSEYALNHLYSKLHRTRSLAFFGPTFGLSDEWNLDQNHSFEEMSAGQIQLLPNNGDENVRTRVLSTAWALLAFLEKRVLIQKPLADWLNTQRSQSDGGWGGVHSTYWSVEAIQTMEQMSAGNNNGIVPGQTLTDQNLRLNVQTDGNELQTLFVNESNRHQVREIWIEQTSNRTLFQATGSGFVQLQIEAQFDLQLDRLAESNQDGTLGLLQQHASKHFDFTLNNELVGANGSSFLVNFCISSNKPTSEDYESPKEDHLIRQTELQLPSGYHVERKELERLRLEYGQLWKLLEDLQVRKQTLVFSFEKPSQCINLLVKRFHPVANLFSYVIVRVFERERPQNAILKLRPVPKLQLLQVCDVCASYQCAQCPESSSNSSFKIKSNTFVLLLISSAFLLSYRIFQFK